MLYVSNAFSLSMLTNSSDTLFVRTLEPKAARMFLDAPGVRSVVGHADLARLATAQVGVEIAYDPKRPSIQLRRGDRLLVAQYSGTRLPEGATSLPEGARIEWKLVNVVDDPPEEDSPEVDEMS